MKHIKLFESFSLPKDVEGRALASDLSKSEYWEPLDYNDGKTAEEWAQDPGYLALSKNLESPLDSILVFDSDHDDVEGLKDEVESLSKNSYSESIKSNQEYIDIWNYYPEEGIAVARSTGGGADWYFVRDDNRLYKSLTPKEKKGYDSLVRFRSKFRK